MATYMAGIIPDHMTPEEIRRQAYNEAVKDYHRTVENNLVMGNFDMMINDGIARMLMKKEGE